MTTFPVHARDGMRVTFIASGSRGNTIAVASGDDVVLVDVGLSAKETRRRLAEAAVDESRVRAILLTHEHRDHVAGVRVLARSLGVPVLGTEGTLEAASRYLTDVETVDRVRPGDMFAVGSLRVVAFPTSHDAIEPVGYVFEDGGGGRFGLASDTGHVPEAALELLGGCGLVGLECNHDVEMLQRGPYPYPLKRRILSRSGHLSNDDAATALERLIDMGVREVCALHLSEQNNTPEMARDALERCVRRLDADVRISVALQHVCVGCDV